MWIKLARDEVLATYRPQVIVQLLGTNDLLGGASADAILEQYDKLLELYREYLPSIRVVVGTPPPIDSGVCGCDAEQAALADSLAEWAAEASTDESPVMIADLSTGFDPATDTDDGIHPNDTGNAKLAAAWTPVIESALATQPVEATAGATAEPTPVATPSPAVQIDADQPEGRGQWWFLGGAIVVVVAAGAFFAARSRS
jgi:hypothetical protein